MTTPIAALLVDACEQFLAEALGRLDEAGHRGLSVSHAFAVQLIDGGVTTITTLAASMRMTPQAVSVIVDQLAARGLVERQRQPNDARAKILSLTADGLLLSMEIAAALDGAEQGWRELVGGRRLEELLATLEMYVAAGPSRAPSAIRRRRRVRVV